MSGWGLCWNLYSRCHITWVKLSIPFNGYITLFFCQFKGILLTILVWLQVLTIWKCTTLNTKTLFWDYLQRSKVWSNDRPSNIYIGDWMKKNKSNRPNTFRAATAWKSPRFEWNSRQSRDFHREPVSWVMLCPRLPRHVPFISIQMSDSGLCFCANNIEDLIFVVDRLIIIIWLYDYYMIITKLCDVICQMGAQSPFWTSLDFGLM